jgi:diphosphomevalonate decarboxylase
VELAPGDPKDGCDSTTKSIVDMEFWSITILIATTARTAKTISSRDGMNLAAKTSPFYSLWIESTKRDLPEMRTALLARDIVGVGELMAHSCLKMHGLTLSSRPGLVYWNRDTWPS